MADWNEPTLITAYSTFLDTLKARDLDAMQMGLNAITNPAAGMMRYVRASNKFQEYDGAVWQDKVLSIAGGGTSGATAAAAKTALGIGTMGSQDASAVVITGGTLAGVTGLVMAGDITFDANATRNVGSYANQARNVYIGAALVLPVGVNKYATA